MDAVVDRARAAPSLEAVAEARLGFAAPRPGVVWALLERAFDVSAVGSVGARSPNCRARKPGAPSSTMRTGHLPAVAPNGPVITL